MGDEHVDPDENWRADWAAHAERQRARWRTTTPQQRLAWLEDALRLASLVTPAAPGRRRPRSEP